MMRRNVVLVVTSLFALTLLPGCSWWKNRKSKATAEATPINAPQYVDYASPAPAGGDPYAGYANYTAPAASQPVAAHAPAYTASYGGGAGGGRVHVVQKGDTIFKLARDYYGGDASKWRTIYDANRDQIANPNQIRVGQRLVIP